MGRLRGGRRSERDGLVWACVMTAVSLAAAPGTAALRASVGILVPLHSPGGEPWQDMRPVAAAAILAAHHINQRNSTLVPDMEALFPPGFVLEYDLQSSMLDPAVSVASALQWQREGRHVLVGSFEFAVTSTLALTASIDRTPVVSWFSSSPALSAKDEYPTLSRVVPSDWAYAAEVMRSIASFGWRNLGIIYIDDKWARCGLHQPRRLRSGVRAARREPRRRDVTGRLLPQRWKRRNSLVGGREHAGRRGARHPRARAGSGLRGAAARSRRPAHARARLR
eukprot:3814437-Rhodomonas_salina.1